MPRPLGSFASARALLVKPWREVVDLSPVAQLPTPRRLPDDTSCADITAKLFIFVFSWFSTMSRLRSNFPMIFRDGKYCIAGIHFFFRISSKRLIGYGILI